jgi:hypothetical protein
VRRRTALPRQDAAGRPSRLIYAATPEESAEVASTVTRVSDSGLGIVSSGDEPKLRYRQTLPRNMAALDEVEGILIARDIIVKAARRIPLRVGVPDFAVVGETVTVQVTPDEPARQDIHLAVRDETGALVEARTLRPSKGTITANVDGLAPGAYTIDITGSGLMSAYAPVSSDILVWQNLDT